MINSPSYSEPLTHPRCASYPDNHLPGEASSQKGNRNPDDQTVSPFNTETTETFSNNGEKENFPHRDPGTMP
jgi:hypothetical protein